MGNIIPKTQSRNLNQDQSEGRQQQQQQKLEEETVTCEICIEPIKSIFKNSTSKRCIHPFCTDCMIKYIQLKLQDNVSYIKCPATTCDHFLDPLSCRAILTNQLFNIWCDALCESTLLGVDRVYCPQIECSGLILNECGSKHKLKKCECPYCKKLFCFECNLAWHAGFSCQESEEMSYDENDVAFGVVCETEGWKRCPNCKLFIDKYDGCETVTCRCGFEFYYYYNVQPTVSLSDWDSSRSILLNFIPVFIFLVIILVVSVLISD